MVRDSDKGRIVCEFWRTGARWTVRATWEEEDSCAASGLNFFDTLVRAVTLLVEGGGLRGNIPSPEWHDELLKAMEAKGA